LKSELKKDTSICTSAKVLICSQIAPNLKENRVHVSYQDHNFTTLTDTMHISQDFLCWQNLSQIEPAIC